jgi:hypothetical protein
MPVNDLLTITRAAARVYFKWTMFAKASGRLVAEEWVIVRGDLVAWAKDEGGHSKRRPLTPVEREGGPIPEHLLRKLGRREPFKDIPECPQCGRRVIVPNEEGT